jgi:hypothetical protein
VGKIYHHYLRDDPDAWTDAPPQRGAWWASRENEDLLKLLRRKHALEGNPGSRTLANATELTIDIEFPMDAYYVIGGGGLVGSLAEQKVGVSGNIKTLFENTSLIDYAIAGTERALKITVTGSASSIFELEVQELLYERNSVDVPGPQGLLVEMNFQGYYANGGEASGIVARLTNGTANYDTGVLPSASPSSSSSASVSPSTSISPSSSASPS